MLNRRMPNGTYWWCERGIKFPLLDWKKGGKRMKIWITVDLGMVLMAAAINLVIEDAL